MQKKIVVLAAAMAIAAPVVGMAAMAGSNTVNSAAIVDGSVATVDIANKAVTAAKIADATITAGQLANGTVTGAKIATGTVSSANLATYAVTTSAIASGAITDEKISGTISGSKLGTHSHIASDISGVINTANLPVGSTSGTVAPGDHNHDAIYQKKFGSVVVAATSGGDYSSPQAALADLDTWCSSTPCLVKVMPGTYTSSLQSAVPIHKYVTVEGSGEGSTNIVCGQVVLYNDAEIRSLTITGTMPIYSYYTPVAPPYANSTGPAIARNVTLNTVSNDGTGIVNYFANLELTNVKINVAGSGNGTGAAVNSLGAYVKMNNVSISLPDGASGIIADGYTKVYVANSSIVAPASSKALSFGPNTGTIYVNNSLISGQIVPTGGTVKCVSAFDGNYDQITCQ